MNDPFGGYQPQVSLRTHPTMQVRDLACQLHMPIATRSQFVGGTEATSRLAPPAPVGLLRVDDYPGCPASWVRSTHTQASYFFAAKPGHMVWFDLRACERNTHHVAALISAQGINAITGVQMTPPPRLEQQPKQNYIATTSVRPGQFWRDGFCARDGQTREFLFTEDVQRGVAAQVIGEERVNAFGVALFKSTQPKPRPAYSGYRGGGQMMGGPESMSKGVTRGASSRGMEVGAGALVNQQVEQDSSAPGFWCTTPDAVFVVYYVGAEEYSAIVGRGSTPQSEGFITTPVGNP